jgi:hypothetical protein
MQRKERNSSASRYKNEYKKSILKPYGVKDIGALYASVGRQGCYLPADFLPVTGALENSRDVTVRVTQKKKWYKMSENYAPYSSADRIFTFGTRHTKSTLVYCVSHT